MGILSFRFGHYFNLMWKDNSVTIELPKATYRSLEYFYQGQHIVYKEIIMFL